MYLQLRKEFAAHEIQEIYIKESPLDWIIVRPAALTDGEHTGSYQHGYTADNNTVKNKFHLQTLPILC